MRERGKGRIINIGSISGERGAKYAGAHYSISKAAVIMMTKLIANVDVGKYCSPNTLTDMFGLIVNAVIGISKTTIPAINMIAGRVSEMFPQEWKHGIHNLGQDRRARIVIKVNGKPGLFHGIVIQRNLIRVSPGRP